METHQQELKQQQAQTGAIEAKLADLADKYRTMLTSSQPKLPREVDLQIRTLEVDLAVAKQNAQFAELAVHDFENVQSEIEHQTEELDDLRASLEVTFIQAEGQQVLLGKIGELRSRRAQAQRLGTNIAQMGPLVAQATQQNEKVNELIQKFLDHDFRPRADGTRKAKSIATRGGDASGVAILKKYLKTSNETAVTNVSK